ncbi:MAG: glycerol-3-phosphate dehydrogenase/oxidase, partial [Nitrolancea sp.]
MTLQRSRAETLAGIERQQFDLIVIGAGINGAGIARDAAMRGLRVLLLDKGDVASGTTSYSTRLIHGGLRYLEHAEFGLVRESLRERETLLRIAPHLVRPLSFLIPLYAESRRGPRLIRMGMLAYDLLSFDKSLPWHHMLSPEKTLEREPGLNPDGLRGGVQYTDGQATFPERLTLENALSAVDHGAALLTYAHVDDLLRSAGRIEGVEFRDLPSGKRYDVRAPLTINVAGPWVDDVLGNTQHDAMIGGTKGTHIVVGPFDGAPSSALYVVAGADGRPYFVVPWNGQFLIGTTDLPYNGDLDQVMPSEEEIGYLIDETNRALPTAGLGRSDVHYAYAGVRPLPTTSADNTSSITRRHIIHDHAPALEGLVSIIGGKITTYRNLAEETVDLIFRKLGRISPCCVTGESPLPGATGVDWPGFAETFHDASALSPQTADRLLHIYGIAAWEILDVAKRSPDLLQPFDPFSGAMGAEVVYALE